jgi:hypothetical protein
VAGLGMWRNLGAREIQRRSPAARGVELTGAGALDGHRKPELGR